MLKIAFIHYIPFGDVYKFLGIGLLALALRRYANNVDIARTNGYGVGAWRIPCYGPAV